MSATPPDFTVLVHVDSLPVLVPPWVPGIWSARGVLGVPRGCAVKREVGDGVLDFSGGFAFADGDRFLTVAFEAMLAESTPLVDDDAEDAAPWQTDPDAWKKG